MAWASMLGMVGVMAAVKWNQPGFRDPDITSPFEMALVFMVVLAIPLALMSGFVLAPAAAFIDAWLGGRLTLGWNLLIGATLALPAIAVFVAVGTMLYGPPNGMVADLSMGLTVFAVGGIIMSLGMHRRGT
jgi:hypothetical protein